MKPERNDRPQTLVPTRNRKAEKDRGDSVWCSRYRRWVVATALSSGNDWNKGRAGIDDMVNMVCHVHGSPSPRVVG